MTTPESSLDYSDRSVGYDALSSARRRFMIRTLHEAETSMTLMELATAIAEWEREQGAETDEQKLVEELYATLYHVHVPKLADAGFVRYDKERQRVRLSDAAPIDLVEQFDE